MRGRLALWLVVLCVAAPSRAAAESTPIRDEIELALAAATVVVDPDCTGVLADGPDLVFTAAECVRGRESVELTFLDGTTRTGWVAVVDRVTDQALLVLEEPAAAAPLDLAPRRPIAGAVLYFHGHPDTGRFREIRVQRVARAASLPLLQNALHTTIVGVPGDAGAAIIDGAGRLAAIVHGGPHGSVATPVTGLRRLVEKLLASGDEVP